MFVRDNTIEYKVKVFISSICGGRYTIVRKALKALLSETNLTTIYEFEDTLGSSQYVTQSYINKLNDSDLCIFLIDNKDGVSDSVLREQKRSKELGLKCIYMFCDEDEREPTQLQKEIVSSLYEKFYVVHEFSDFPIKAYLSIMQDITDIYRSYCKGYVINKEIDTGKSELNHQYTDIYTIDKELFSGFDLTKNALVSILDHSTLVVNEASNLDSICKKLLYVVIGKESISSFNFDDLISELKNIHDNKDILNFINIRWKAIKSYFNNNLDECILNLRLAYEQAISSVVIPNWMAIDVLIDMRNTINLLDESKSQYSFENDGQRLLSENKESVYYPLIDRYEATLKEELSKDCYNHFTKSPYTTRFGGITTLFNNISQIFVVSVLYGSLTHILMTRNRISDTLANLAFIYKDHAILIEVLRNLILCQNDNKIESLVRSYNQSTEMINELDAENLYNVAGSIPIKHKRFISKLIAFKYFGYYFSDKLFAEVETELVNEIDNWLESYNRVFNVSTYIFKALLANTRRIDNDKLSKLILKVFNKNLKRWYDDALKLIKFLDFQIISFDTSALIVECLLKLVKEEEVTSNCNNLQSAVIYVRKNCSYKRSDIDQSVEEYMKSFYLENYSLEVFEGEERDSLKHISRFIQEIHHENEVQGKNGIYSSWWTNPYKTIENIIRNNKLTLEWESIAKIIKAIEETIFTREQIISAKVSSIQLLVFLTNNSNYKKELYLVYKKWMQNIDIILSGHEDGIFQKETIETLKFNVLIMEIVFGVHDVNNLLTSLSVLTQQNDYEVIKSLESIENLLFNIEFNELDPSTLIVLTQYVIGMSKHKEKDVRYLSLRILFLLCNSDFNRAASMQISRMMDNDVYTIKIFILNRLDVLMKYDTKIAELIKQKGRVDNHFLVRKLSN